MSETNGQTEEQTKSRDHLWKPGQSGNPGGRPKGTFSLVRLMREALAENDLEGAKAVVKAAVDKAKKGSFTHWQEMLNRIDGKQSSGEGGNVSVTIVFRDE